MEFTIPEHFAFLSVGRAQDFSRTVLEGDIGQVDDHGDIDKLFSFGRGDEGVVARVTVQVLVVAEGRDISTESRTFGKQSGKIDEGKIANTHSPLPAYLPIKWPRLTARSSDPVSFSAKATKNG